MWGHATGLSKVITSMSSSYAPIWQLQLLVYFVAFNGILAFRQQHRQPGAFGQSDLFFVCHMTPLSYELRPSMQEIAVCQWMTLDDLDGSGQTSAITKHVCKVIRHGLVNGFDRVLFGCSEQPSIYRNRTFSMYSVLAGMTHGEDCVHSAVDAPDEIL